MAVLPAQLAYDVGRSHLGNGRAGLLGGMRSHEVAELAAQPLEEQDLLLPR